MFTFSKNVFELIGSLDRVQPELQTANRSVFGLPVLFVADRSPVIEASKFSIRKPIKIRLERNGEGAE